MPRRPTLRRYAIHLLPRMVRLQKLLADAGVSSRRGGEQLILAGRVSVNGRIVRELGTRVHETHDDVAVDGNPVRIRRKQYVALHKPVGCVCSRKDELGRPTIYQLLPKEWSNLYSVGRLDYDTEGLLFLTNDGEFALRLTHPRYRVRKKYIATVEGRVTREVIERLQQGVFDRGERLRAERAHLITASLSRSTVELDLAEGRNREVRRMFESQGFAVTRLQRVQIGRIKLGELKAGRWRTLTEPEIKSLLG